MAVKYFSTGGVKIVSTARGKIHPVPKFLEEIPGGLYPMRMAVYEIEEYRMANGWSVPVPKYDVRARTLASAEGEVLASRDDIRALETDAFVRWISDDDTYSVTDLRWTSIQGEPMHWETAADYAPTLINDYEYRVGSEVFVRDALNFDSDSFEHMWCDFSPVLGGTFGYSVIMVASLNSVYGNNVAVPYSGIWCHGKPTPALGEPFWENPSGGFVNLSLQGQALYLETDQRTRARALSVAHLVSATAPMMIAMVVSHPYTTIYAGSGPSSISRATMAAGELAAPYDGRVVLGRTTGDILHSADMALLDVGVYSGQLTPSQVQDEFAKLSSVYGGDK